MPEQTWWAMIPTGQNRVAEVGPFGWTVVWMLHALFPNPCLSGAADFQIRPCFR